MCFLISQERSDEVSFLCSRFPGFVVSGSTAPLRTFSSTSCLPFVAPHDPDSDDVPFVATLNPKSGNKMGAVFLEDASRFPIYRSTGVLRCMQLFAMSIWSTAVHQRFHMKKATVDGKWLAADMWAMGSCWRGARSVLRSTVSCQFRPLSFYPLAFVMRKHVDVWCLGSIWCRPNVSVSVDTILWVLCAKA